jgi:thiamine-phosphate pyrophosphorylase
MTMPTTVASRMGRLRLPMLSLITDRQALKSTDLEIAVSEAVAGGVMMVQLRERDLPTGELLELAKRLRAVTRGKALLMINDRLDVTQASESDGVHLPENGLPVGIARWLLGRYALVGRSVHSVEAAVEAERAGADYVQVGTIFASPSHPEQEPAGVELIRAVRNAVAVPVIAVGGITAENAGQVIEAGAHGIAVISAILRADDRTAAAKALKQAIQEAWTQRLAAASAQR